MNHNIDLNRIKWNGRRHNHEIIECKLMASFRYRSRRSQLFSFIASVRRKRGELKIEQRQRRRQRASSRSANKSK